VRDPVHVVAVADETFGEMAPREAGDARDEHASRHRPHRTDTLGAMVDAC
jgi:hypothetical protein